MSREATDWMSLMGSRGGAAGWAAEPAAPAAEGAAPGPGAGALAVAPGAAPGAQASRRRARLRLQAWYARRAFRVHHIAASAERGVSGSVESGPRVIGAPRS